MKTPAITRFVAVLLAVAGSSLPGAQPDGTNWRVLSLDQEDWGRPIALSGTAAYRRVLIDELEGRVAISGEGLDLARFDRPDYLTELRNWLKQKYRVFQPNVINATGKVAFELAVSLRSELWPDVPIVFCAIPEEDVARMQLPPNCTGVIHRDLRLRDSVELAVRLFPSTRRIAFIAGDVQREPFNQPMYQEFLELRDRFETIDLTNLSMAELQKRVASLPENTIVYYSCIFVDGEGKLWGGPQALRQLAPLSNRPIFCSHEAYMELGVIGGDVGRGELIGEDLARQTILALRAKSAADVPVAKRIFATPVFDARQLRRWHVPESRLPKNSTLLHEEFSVWKSYRWEIVGGLGLVALQTTLLAGLFFQRFERRRAERGLRESNQFLDLAGESADIGIWSWQTATNEITFNAKCRKILGVGPSSPLDATSFQQLVHPEDRVVRQAALDAAVSAHERYDVEYRIVRPDGEIRWVASRALAEPDVAGKITHIRGVMADISQRKRMEAELDRRRNELAHFTRIATLSEMAAALSHELGQPLTAMVSLAEAAGVLLAEQPPRLPQAREAIGNIQLAGRRAREMMAKVRGLYQKRAFQPGPLSPDQLLRDVVRLLNPVAAQRNLMVRMECDDPIPFVRGDRIYLEQALINLAMNGIEASLQLPPEKRQLLLSARLTGDGSVAFAVRDWGSGISSKDLTQAFEPFWTTKQDGLGLGLPLVQTIVQAHGGRVRAENNSDAGATFGFVLPAISEEVSS